LAILELGGGAARPTVAALWGIGIFSPRSLATRFFWWVTGLRFLLD